MAQNLDPSSDGRGVLQFKTGLMSVIKVQRQIHCLLILFICIEVTNSKPWQIIEEIIVFQLSLEKEFVLDSHINILY